MVGCDQLWSTSRVAWLGAQPNLDRAIYPYIQMCISLTYFPQSDPTNCYFEQLLKTLENT